MPKTAAAEKKAQATGRTSTALFVPLADTTDYIRSLHWGKEGSTKTTSALTMANHGRILVINSEDGVKKKALSKMGINVNNIMVYPANPMDAITKEGLDQVFYQVKQDLQEDADSWFGIVFDSVTDVNNVLIDQIASNRVQGWVDKDVEFTVEEQYTTDRNDYGISAKMIRDTIRKFRTLPVHLVFTALERKDVDKDTGKVTYGPALPPALQSDLLGYVDVVIQCLHPTEDLPVYHGRTRSITTGNQSNRAKDRINFLPSTMVEPTMTRILDYLEDQYDEDSDVKQEAVIAARKRQEERAAALREKKERLAARRAERRAKRGEKPAPEEDEDDESEEDQTPDDD